MRFIRREKIITTMYDKEVSDVDTLSVIFKGLLENQIEFSCVVIKRFESDYLSTKISYDRVRVKRCDLENHVLDLLILQGSSVVTLKNIRYLDIFEVNATTSKNKVEETITDLSRWDLLDI